MHTLLRSTRALLAAASIFAAGATCAAHWAIPGRVPVGRLVANLTAYTKEHPDDAQGFYLLGRVHGLAFVKHQARISVWNHRERQNIKVLPDVATDDFQYDETLLDRGDPKPAPTSEGLAHHMSQAVKNFARAIELHAKAPAVYHLGFAYVLELGASMAEKSSTVPAATPLDKLPDDKRKQIEDRISKLASESESVRKTAMKSLRAELRDAALLIHAHRDDENTNVKNAVHELLAGHWREEAIAHYYQAYVEAIDEDSKIDTQPLRGLNTLVSYEAGVAYIKLMKARGAITREEKDRLAKAEKDIDALDHKPHSGIMTPIIFPPTTPQPLDSLLDSSRIVLFDLDGDGVAELRPWLQPGAALLVWDPDHTGVITSGRQLFGSVTWWFFFSDGYRALDALDDNRDARLSGPELAGLGVWFDLDADAVSDPGEVVPIELTSIASISARATTTELNCPANPHGLVLSDSRTLPTYDWIAAAIEPDARPALSRSPIVLTAADHTPPQAPSRMPSFPCLNMVAIADVSTRALRSPRVA